MIKVVKRARVLFSSVRRSLAKKFKNNKKVIFRAIGKGLIYLVKIIVEKILDKLF